MVVVAQLVRALDCGSKGRGFESPQPPKVPDLRAPVAQLDRASDFESARARPKAELCRGYVFRGKHNFPGIQLQEKGLPGVKPWVLPLGSEPASGRCPRSGKTRADQRATGGGS